METQAFWNNREVEMIDTANRIMTPAEKLNALRGNLLKMDSAAMGESGIDNSAAIATLRLEIAKIEASMSTDWTKEQTIARRTEWNARVKSGEFAAKPGKPTAVQVTAAEKAQGWTVADLKKFVAKWGL